MKHLVTKDKTRLNLGLTLNEAKVLDIIVHKYNGKDWYDKPAKCMTEIIGLTPPSVRTITNNLIKKDMLIVKDKSAKVISVKPSKKTIAIYSGIEV